MKIDNTITQDHTTALVELNKNLLVSNTFRTRVITDILLKQIQIMKAILSVALERGQAAYFCRDCMTMICSQWGAGSHLNTYKINDMLEYLSYFDNLKSDEMHPSMAIYFSQKSREHTSVYLSCYCSCRSLGGFDGWWREVRDMQLKGSSFAEVLNIYSQDQKHLH